MHLKQLRFVLLAALVFAGVCSLPDATYSEGEARLYVYRSKIIDTSYVPSTTFNVAILVANVTDMNTLKFNMTFDSNILSYRGHSIGALNNSPRPKWLVDDNLGFIWFNITYWPPISASSSLMLANITFHVRGLGSSVLGLSDTSLLDSDGSSIAHSVSDGYFANFNPYDLNEDGKVDVKDIVIVAAAFGTYPGHPSWNERADVNQDGQVDIRDIALVAAHFGE